VGLNLTEADTVIHYDPWWNPATENQATDRAYRIGQEKPVFVYKMIARGTVKRKSSTCSRRNRIWRQEYWTGE
jgi:SNF2 family DNA or RNA helicase